MSDMQKTFVSIQTEITSRDKFIAELNKVLHPELIPKIIKVYDDTKISLFKFNRINEMDNRIGKIEQSMHEIEKIQAKTVDVLKEFTRIIQGVQVE